MFVAQPDDVIKKHIDHIRENGERLPGNLVFIFFSPLKPRGKTNPIVLICNF
jgi:hypothetical protein